MGDILDRHTRKQFVPLEFWILVLLFSPAEKLFPADLTPISIGHANDGGNAYGVAVAGHFAYLANYNDGLRIYDISNPANPVSVGHINHGFAAGVALAGNLACVADSADGLRIYDVSNPANPVSVGNTNNGASASSVAVAGNYAYLANNGDGLRIYDISNPANPVNVGHAAISISGNASGVAVAGNYVYLANNGDGLRIYDVSNPANPVNIGSTNDPGFALGVAVAGNNAYLANGFDGLRIYDVSTPANPIGIGYAPITGGNAFAVTTSGNYAYLANFDDGLHIYNIYDPSNPVAIAAINDGGFARGIAVSGNYAYLANGSDGLRVYLLQPQLTLTSDNNNNLVITWPAPSTFYVLQEDSTGNDDWLAVTTVPTVVAGQNQVVIPQPPGSANFRLAIVQPQLTMAIDSTGITLSWPAYFAGFVPQQTDNPSGTNWVTLNNTQFTVAGQYQVHVRQTASIQFFRLISQ